MVVVNSNPSTVLVCLSCLNEHKFTEFEFDLAKIKKLNQDDLECSWCQQPMHKVKLGWDRI